MKKIMTEYTYFKKPDIKGAIDKMELDISYWEEVPEEDLWEDGELNTQEVVMKMASKVIRTGEWRLMRRKQ